VIERPGAELAHRSSLVEIPKVLAIGNRPTAVGHPSAQGEVLGIEERGLSLPVIRRAPEITQTHGMERRIGRAARLASVQGLDLGLGIETAAFEQRDLDAATRERSRERDAGRAGAD